MHIPKNNLSNPKCLDHINTVSNEQGELQNRTVSEADAKKPRASMAWEVMKALIPCWDTGLSLVPIFVGAHGLATSEGREVGGHGVSEKEAAFAMALLGVVGPALLSYKLVVALKNDRSAEQTNGAQYSVISQLRMAQIKMAIAIAIPAILFLYVMSDIAGMEEGLTKFDKRMLTFLMFSSLVVGVAFSLITGYCMETLNTLVKVIKSKSD